MSKYYFEKFNEEGIPTHYLASDLEKNTMTVKPVTFFGQGIEVICRFVATGSFIRRYGAYMEDGAPLDAYVEISLKDDGRGDPFISEELLLLFGVLKEGEYAVLRDLTVKISQLIKDDLAKQQMELYDIKLEFGKNAQGEIILIDEISGGNMRVFHEGTSLTPIALSKKIIGE